MSRGFVVLPLQFQRRDRIERCRKAQRQGDAGKYFQFGTGSASGGSAVISQQVYLPDDPPGGRVFYPAEVCTHVVPAQCVL